MILIKPIIILPQFFSNNEGVTRSFQGVSNVQLHLMTAPSLLRFMNINFAIKVTLSTMVLRLPRP